MYDGAVRAHGNDGLQQGQVTRVLGADDIPVDIVSGQHGRQVATVLGAALGCEALTTIDDIIVDDDQVAVVVVSDVLQETFGVNVGSGQQGEVDQSGLRVCS